MKFMIEKNIKFPRTLIIGAGSSASYGFPTGEDLKKLIISNNLEHFYDSIGISSPNTRFRESYINYSGVVLYFDFITTLMANVGSKQELLVDLPGNKNFYIKQDELLDFKSKLKRSGVLSIDTFISQLKNERYETIAKILIILCIGAFSHAENTYNSNDDWIHFLISQCLDWKDVDNAELPNFISFNYDNLLKDKIKNYSIGRSEENYGLKLNSKIKIKNVYGSINSDSFNGYPNIHKNNRGAFLREFINSNFNEIEFIRNGSINEISKDLNALIDKSYELIFLGYGFDRNNNQLLFGNDEKLKFCIKEKFLDVTSYGLPDYILKYICEAKGCETFLKNGLKCRNVLLGSFTSSMFP